VAGAFLDFAHYASVNWIARRQGVAGFLQD
jgi:hypothetical protein